MKYSKVISVNDPEEEFYRETEEDDLRLSSRSSCDPDCEDDWDWCSVDDDADCFCD